MTDRRTARLNEQLKREVSQIISRKVRDPRVGQVLITEVRVTADLWLARIFFRPLEPEASLPEMAEGLEAASPFIRKELGNILRVRRIPELRFIHDTSLDEAARIEEVLKEVLPPEDREGEGREGGTEGSGDPASGGGAEPLGGS